MIVKGNWISGNTESVSMHPFLLCFPPLNCSISGNQCYFYPDMATSRDTCRLPPRLEDSKTAVEGTRMITNGSHSARAYSFNSMMPPKAINRNCTRLRGAFLQHQADAKKTDRDCSSALEEERRGMAGIRKAETEAGKSGKTEAGKFIPAPSSCNYPKSLTDCFTLL